MFFKCDSPPQPNRTWPLCKLIKPTAMGRKKAFKMKTSIPVKTIVMNYHNKNI